MTEHAAPLPQALAERGRFRSTPIERSLGSVLMASGGVVLVAGLIPWSNMSDACSGLERGLACASLFGAGEAMPWALIPIGALAFAIGFDYALFGALKRWAPWVAVVMAASAAWAVGDLTNKVAGLNVPLTNGIDAPTAPPIHAALQWPALAGAIGICVWALAVAVARIEQHQRP